MNENIESNKEKEVPSSEAENVTESQATENSEENGKPSIEQQLEAEKDKYIRLFAEFENFKKRTNKEKLDFFKYANQELMLSLLPVLDDFDRAIAELSKEGEDEKMEGIKLIRQKFFNTLKEKGLEKIEVEKGDTFDVEKHEAITKVPVPSADLKDKIIDVIEEGYRLKDRIIRYAKVVLGQ